MQSIKILIDNIFCNIPNPLLQSAISANITFSISDYLPRFFILSDYFTNSSPTKSNIIFHDSQYFNNQLFFADVETINWNQVLQLNLSLTLDNYLSTVDALIDSHEKRTTEKCSKKQNKFQQKPWITRGIQNSVLKKNRILKYIKSNNHDNENSLHNEFKSYSNQLK